MLDVPLYMQGTETGYCVPYGLVGIAEFYGIKVSKKDMIAACKTHKTQGTLKEDYIKGIQQFGLKFVRIKYEYGPIRRALKAYQPVILSFRTSKTETHFTTIVGARKNNRGIYFYTLNDTFFGHIEVPGSLLEYLWKKDSSWSRKVVYK